MVTIASQRWNSRLKGWGGGSFRGQCPSVNEGEPDVSHQGELNLVREQSELHLGNVLMMPARILPGCIRGLGAGRPGLKSCLCHLLAARF